MQLFEDLDQLAQATGPGVSMCLGVFDGVHRGHRMLMDRAKGEARRLGLPSLVFTFTQHPLSVLAPPYVPPMLTTADEKAQLIAADGIDLCLMLDFTPQLAAMAPQVFLEEVLAGVCRARFIACGRDFHFGKNGAGDIAMLQAEGPRLGFAVEVCEDLLEGPGPIKSSRVRQRLLDGHVDEARLLLGRPYALGGRVVHGDGRGRTIGIPTANLLPPARRLVPENGVYAVRAVLPGGRKTGGMLNIGTRPTFDGHDRTIEVHLFEIDEDLYGQWLVVEFIQRIRDERRFASADALVAQLHVDRQACLDALAV